MDRTEQLCEVEESLVAVQEYLEEAIERAEYASRMAARAGGEVARCVAGQIDAYLIPLVQALVTDARQPGSIATLGHILQEAFTGQSKGN